MSHSFVSFTSPRFPSSAPRRARTAGILALAAVAALSAPLAAQGDAPAQDQRLESIAADGFSAFMQLMEQLAKEQIARLPSGDKSPRENAYGKLAAIQLAGAGSALALPAAGVALGGGIGLCVDACTAGADGGAGTVIGGSIGLGSGIVVGVGAFVTSLLATLPMVDEIEAKYPPEAGAAGGMFAVRGAGLPAAGMWESFYVNLVATLPDQFVTVIEQWDRTPGLGAAEKNWLRSIRFARPHLQRLAWIKRNLRASPDAPRANDLFLDIGRVLSGDQEAMERAWLAALGLGSTGLELRGDKLTLDVPPPLQALGLPARLQSSVPDLHVRVGGNGGAFDPYLRIRLEAGPFDINWGKLSVVKSGANHDLVAIEYSIAKGSRLGSARISFKAGGDETKVVDLRPSLDRTLKGTLFFRLRGMALEFDKAQLGDLELSFGIPREIRDLPVVKDLLNGLLADFQRDARKFLRDTVPFAKLFDGFGQRSVQSLAGSVRRDPGSHGFASIDQVTKVEVERGVVQVTVRGRMLKHPKLPVTVEEARSAWTRFLPGKGRPIVGVRPGVVGGR